MGTNEAVCCRSTPKRCATCPVVLQRLDKIRKQALVGRELRRAVKAALAY